MLQNSLSCKILRVIISARVFPIQKSLCKIASLSKIGWEFLEIVSSTLWPFSAIAWFFFYISVFNLILVFILIYWSIFLPIRTFSCFSIFPSLSISLSIRKEICRNVFRIRMGRAWAMSQEGLSKRRSATDSFRKHNSQTLVVCSIRFLFSFFVARSLEPVLCSGSHLFNCYCSSLALSCLDITNFILIFPPTSPWCKWIFQYDSIKCYEYWIIFKF